MPSLPPTSIATRKRTRSTNIAENNGDHSPAAASNTLMPTSINISPLATSTIAVNAPPKRQRNNPPPVGPPPPITPRSSYSLRNRSVTPDPRHPAIRLPSVHTSSMRSAHRQSYNLRSRRPQSQVRLPQVSTIHPIIAPRRSRPLIPPINNQTTTSSSIAFNQLSSSTLQSLRSRSSPQLGPPLSPPPPPPPPASMSSVMPSNVYPTPPVIQPRQYRLVYISDDDDEPAATTTIVNTTFNLVTDDEDDEPIRPPTTHRRVSQSSSGTGLNARSCTNTAVPSSAASTSSSSSNSSVSTTTINSQDVINGIAYVRLNRAIEVVIDSIQSLEGAVNSFDQFVFGLIFGRLGTGAESDSIEGIIRLSHILNLNSSSRLSQAEIDALPKIIFAQKTNPTSSILVTEKCPICLTEFIDQETINQLYCTHLFHPQCISTWLSENDSCPTCRRKVVSD